MIGSSSVLLINILGRRNSFHLLKNTRMDNAPNTGLETGTMILVNRIKSFAPSTLAASRSSSGMVSIFFRNINMANTFAIPVMICTL